MEFIVFILVLNGKRVGRFQKFDLRAIDLVVVFSVVTSAVMVLLAVTGHFIPIWSVFDALILCAAGGLWRVRSVTWGTGPRTLFLALLLGLCVLAPRWHPFLYTEGGQDEGVYVAMSAHFARTHGIGITDRVRQALPEAKRDAYDQANNGRLSRVPHRYEGLHEPGVYVGDLGPSSYVFQFYPLHPLWMALAAEVLGPDLRVYSVVWFSVLNILVLSLIAYEVSGRQMAAFVTGALLAVNPLHVFLSRFPVTEHVTLFFSASAFYYLVRYFKSRARGSPGPANLALSAACWAMVFFCHISGFFYGPLVAIAVVGGIVTSRDAVEARHMVLYGAATLAAYFVSLWYGATWSFPYSYDIYRAAFGTTLGSAFILRWHAVAAVAAMLFAIACWAAWRFRSSLTTSRGNIGSLLPVLIVGALYAVLAYALFDAYRLGFTDRYANDVFVGRIWGLSHSGVDGLLHAGIVVVAIYLSPFILGFVLLLAVSKRRSMGPHETYLLAGVALFALIRVCMDPVTLYFYYARYLGAELVPYMLVLAAIWLSQLLSGSRRARAAAGAILALSLVWETAVLTQQYPGGENYRFDASVKPLAERVRPEDIVLFAGVKDAPLRTTLDYYYGKNTVVTDRASLDEDIALYSRPWADVYVLSESDSLRGPQYVGAFTVARDHYARRGRYSVIAMNSTPDNNRYYLYRVDRSRLAVLGEGSVIAFDRNGNSSSYLGSGWSVQEESMRWTDGERATLLLPFRPDTSQVELRFHLRSFGCIPAVVRINGEVRARWTFDPKQTVDCVAYVERSVTLDAEDIRRGRSSGDEVTVAVTLEFPGVRSAHDLDPTKGDGRKLGVSVRRIDIRGLHT